MKPSFELYHGDCLEVMASLPTESVDAIVTSPPYAEQRKSTYGGIPEAEYPAWTVAWMAEARRILKPSGSVIINIRPHIKNGQLADYVLHTRIALRAVGWAELEELVWHKRSAMPTGSPSRPRRAWESMLWYGKHGRAYGNPKANGKPAYTQGRITSTGHVGERAQRNGWDHTVTGGQTFGAIARCSNVAEINVGRPTDWERVNINHPAPFPIAIAEWCGKLICPPGGTLLDPFSGSGSTGVAAIRNGWDYIGIDAVADYVEMSRQRLEREAAA